MRVASAMFTEDTVFVLGAGASCHYGYPTGETLVQRVIEKGRQLELFCSKSENNRYFVNRHLPKIGLLNGEQPLDLNDVGTIFARWNVLAGRCAELVRLLKIQEPLVIDYFLAQNPSVQEIGKLIVALEILECELDFTRDRMNKSATGKDNWIRF